MNYTPEQVESVQRRMGVANHSDCEDAAEMLRAYATTLRQQAERGDGAVSDEVRDSVAKIIADRIGNGMREKYYPQTDAIIEAVAPLLRAPAEQGGRVDGGVVERALLAFHGHESGPVKWPDPSNPAYNANQRERMSAALAQNTQGEAPMGSELCATVADAVRIADKCRCSDDEAVVWVPESCYLTMVGEVERLETLLYTDGNGNISIHVERARVPEWLGSPLLSWALGTIDELNGGPLTADEWAEDAVLYQQARSFLAAAPSQTAQDAGGKWSNAPAGETHRRHLDGPFTQPKDAGHVE